MIPGHVDEHNQAVRTHFACACHGYAFRGLNHMVEEHRKHYQAQQQSIPSRPTREGEKWNALEIETLRRVFGMIPDSELAQQLERSPKSIRQRTSFYNIRRRPA